VEVRSTCPRDQSQVKPSSETSSVEALDRFGRWVRNAGGCFAGAVCPRVGGSGLRSYGVRCSLEPNEDPDDGETVSAEPGRLRRRATQVAGWRSLAEATTTKLDRRAPQRWPCATAFRSPTVLSQSWSARSVRVLAGWRHARARATRRAVPARNGASAVSATPAMVIPSA